MKEEKGLSARKLLREVYNALGKGSREVKLPRPALATIAKDPDCQRGYTSFGIYKAAIILKIDGNEWIIALGTTWALGPSYGEYRGYRYNCDITAMKFCSNEKTNKDIARAIRYALQENFYCRHSLIVAKMDGHLGVRQKGTFNREVSNLLLSTTQEFIAKDIEISHQLKEDLQLAVKSPVQYKPGFVNVLRDNFLWILASKTGVRSVLRNYPPRWIKD